MRSAHDLVRLFRDAERARVVRWFGDAPSAPVQAHAQAVWLAEAERIIDHRIVRLHWLGFETVAIAIVLIAVWPMALAMIGVREMPPLAPVAAALLWPLIGEFLYRSELRGLRRTVAQRMPLLLR